MVLYIALNTVPSNDDELNILEANGNFGWPNVQGLCDNYQHQ